MRCHRFTWAALYVPLSGRSQLPSSSWSTRRTSGSLDLFSLQSSSKTCSNSISLRAGNLILSQTSQCFPQNAKKCPTSIAQHLTQTSLFTTSGLERDKCVIALSVLARKVNIQVVWQTWTLSVCARARMLHMRLQIVKTTKQFSQQFRAR